ncbi:superoxide dismutase family protein [uncultured Corynebacterium sp.]|uniref:superoxide dismutase family protein n=1 Tax=uncultured Corynebacterium sp. TaxID=159447 RepID=UPI00260472E5|nr:superoxide dismutase family protein [uncultured Corynebacterium sp.]
MRHRKNHRITAATLGAGALVLGLTACADAGNGDADVNNAADTTTSTDTTSATTSESAAGDGDDAPEPFATASLRTADDSEIGTVSFTEDGGMVQVDVEVSDLEPGFRGFHVHSTGLCEPDSESPDGDTGDFMSAGGHLTGNADAEGHGNPSGTGHAGDMPSLLVNDDGTATMTFSTDRLTRELLLDDDGSAVMVHTDADNYANVPERYAEDGPDADTLKTGDAGDRALCGVIEE